MSNLETILESDTEGTFVLEKEKSSHSSFSRNSFEGPNGGNTYFQSTIEQPDQPTTEYLAPPLPKPEK